MPQIVTIILIFICVLAVHSSLLYFVGSNSSKAMKLIIDTDAGSDDALALMLALALPSYVNVLAITCTYGNTHEANVQTNVLKVLTLARRNDIPVYAGAEKPLRKNFTAADYFGKDGLGDFQFDREIVGKIDKSKHAAVAMIDLVKQYPGKVSILTLGPLTNLALATQLDVNFARNVKRFYVMGSYINDDDQSKGSSDPEFNFSLDPEAIAIFLSTIPKNTTVVTPWNTVHKNGISKQWRKEVFGKLNSERVEFLNKAEYEVLDRIGVWYWADAMAVATLIWPELITSSLEAHMSSDSCASPDGAVKLDQVNGRRNVEVIWDVDVEGFKQRILKYLA